jgi:hypothetical protein
MEKSSMGRNTGQFFPKTKQDTAVAKPRKTKRKNIKNDERGTRASSAIARKKKMLTHNYLTRAPHTSRRTRRRRSTLVVVVVVVSAGSNLP